MLIKISSLVILLEWLDSWITLTTLPGREVIYHSQKAAFDRKQSDKPTEIDRYIYIYSAGPHVESRASS